MGYLLFIPALYCLADLFLSVRFKTRLTPSSFSLLLSPTSFWSSAKSSILPFLLCAAFLLIFPLLSLALILLSKWPHPFVIAYQELKKKKPIASFPFSTERPQGPKLFELFTEDRPHILFVVLESFRAKNVGCLGASLPLSPRFDRLAEEGILFSRFHSTGTRTNRATIASLFGIPPAHHPSHLGDYCDFSLVGLPQILAKQGYDSALIQGGSTAFDNEAEFLARQGFKTILGKREINKSGTSWGVYDEHLMPFAAAWLLEQKKPIFLNLYTITNHHPWIHPRGAHGFLNTFSYTDEALGILIDQLKKYELLKKTILFIFGDHGQELEDRDPLYEINRHLFQDNVHVPLLIYAQGRIAKPKRIDTVSSHIDLLPTVLDLMNLNHEPHHSLGKSLLRPSHAPIFFSHPFDLPIRGCRLGDWKYLQSEKGEELFDLKSDPEEKINRIEKNHPLKKITDSYFDQLDGFYSKTPEQKKKSSFHLDFKNSLELTDRSLEQIAKDHPELSSIQLINCLLLTDVGIAALIKHCPKLEKLYLEGLDEITGACWGPAPFLVHFKAIHCPRIHIDWVLKLPSLTGLDLSHSSITDQDLILLSQYQTKLVALCLNHLPEITDQGLKPLLENNKNLVLLSVKSCPQITPSSTDAIQSEIFRHKNGQLV